MTESLNRRILALAVPAFAALVAQPAFVAADTAIVGHLGAEPLAGLGVGAAVTSTLVGLFVFLAYGSTATVARLMGGGRHRQALESGVQALWLGLALGVAVALLGWALAPQLAAWLGASGAAHGYAVIYLRWALPGLPGMLATLAATGTLRGLANARAPMWLAIGAALLNLAGDVLLVIGLGMGVGGSGAATAAAETAMGSLAAALVFRGAGRRGAARRPSLPGMAASLSVGVPLLIRTLALRLALLLTTWCAARFGTLPLAAHQVLFTVWSFMQFALDAVAIAGQTLIGQALGASRPEEARQLTRRMVWWSLGTGMLLGAATCLARAPLAGLFTPDADVRALVGSALLLVGASLPVAAWVTLFDGVLIGAGDGAYLARASILTLAGYAPLALAATFFSSGLYWLWAAFAFGFMGLRAVTLWWRERSDDWLVAG